MNDRVETKKSVMMAAFEIDLMQAEGIADLIDRVAATLLGPSKPVLRAVAKSRVSAIYMLGFIAGRAHSRVEFLAAANELLDSLGKALDDADAQNEKEQKP
jgi:hypothetical protein